jgi:hypothetical protein
MSVERNNGLVKAHFQRDVDGQPEDLYENKIWDHGKPLPYKVGDWWWWSNEGAFPHR